jgi:shikimate kinase
MTTVLITGMSGTGKSSVAAALRVLGHLAIDTDDGWSATADDGEWIWDEAKIDGLLRAGHDLLFIAGCASNQGRFRSRLDHVVLLSAPIDVMLERVRTRTTNPFGKDTADVAQIVDDHTHIEPLLRASCTVELDTTRPLDEVVDAILALVGLTRPA